MSDHDKLFTALDEVGRDARRMMLDSLHVELFNLSNGLTGNTEAGDIDWFTRQIYLRADPMRVSGWFDSLSYDEKAYWRSIAIASLEALPYLMGRIADRCQDHAKVIAELLKADRMEQRRKGPADG